MIWLVMIVCGLLTLSMRFVMFSDLAPRQLPGWLEEALGFVPVAVLTAIIVPAVIISPEGGLMLAGNSKLPAALVAVTAALVTRSVLATIASGLGSMWILDYFLYYPPAANLLQARASFTSSSVTPPSEWVVQRMVTRL